MRKAYVHFTLASVAFLIVLGGYLFWGEMFMQARAHVASLTSSVDASTQEVAQAQTASTELAKLSMEESDVRQYFVADDDVVSFLETLQNLGTTLGTTVTVASVSANPAPRPHLELSISVDGSFDGVMRTVGAIEYSPYDLVITTITLDTSDTSGTSAAWTATMNLSVGTASSTPATSATSTATSSSATTTP